MNSPIEINKLSLPTRLRLGRGVKRRNKRLLARLDQWHQQRKTAAEINRALGTGPAELAFLYLLTWSPAERPPLKFSAEARPLRLELLAELGLIAPHSFPPRMSLTDAGRYLLLLSGHRPFTPTEGPFEWK